MIPFMQISDNMAYDDPWKYIQLDRKAIVPNKFNEALNTADGYFHSTKVKIL